MNKTLSLTSYIFWIGTAGMIGFFVVGGIFETGEHIAQAQDVTHTQAKTAPTLPRVTTPKKNIESAVFERSLLGASVVESRIKEIQTPFADIPLLDTNDFTRGSCPQTDTPQTPRYFAPLSRTYALDGYIPGNLVELAPAVATKNNRTICLDETTAVHLKAMLDAAQADGFTILVTSGYRSEETQEELYTNNIQTHGTQEYLRVAEPGHSEHQLGTTVDLTGAGANYDSATAAFGDSPEGLWLQDNAHTYGFIMSYPETRESDTGYIYEPWHWRFVGIENVGLMRR